MTHLYLQELHTHREMFQAFWVALVKQTINAFKLNNSLPGSIEPQQASCS